MSEDGLENLGGISNRVLSKGYDKHSCIKV